MKNTTLGQLKDEARELGCELLFGGRIRLVTYNAEGLYNVTKYFDYKDEACESKIRAELKEIKNRIMDDFYSMSGSIQQLGLEMNYDLGKVVITRQRTVEEKEIITTFSCNPTGLREMTNWVADMLIECLETEPSQAKSVKILNKAQVRLVAPPVSNPAEIRPQEILMPRYFVVNLQHLQEVDPKAAEALLAQYVTANDGEKSPNP